MIEKKIVEVLLDDKYLSDINLDDLHDERKSLLVKIVLLLILAVNINMDDLGNFSIKI
ncbi:MAG: hypothetical protein ACR5KW_03180 [Wolbachia sp.]